jgi:hypothetical protein
VLAGVLTPYRSAMTLWIGVGVLLVVLLAAMWRMDQNARRRGSRVEDAGDIGRHAGLDGRASPYAQGGFDHHGSGGLG